MSVTNSDIDGHACISSDKVYYDLVKTTYNIHGKLYLFVHDKLSLYKENNFFVTDLTIMLANIKYKTQNCCTLFVSYFYK